jgi:hypothetical protein
VIQGDPDAVGDDRELVPVRPVLQVARDVERRGAGVEDDALAVLHERGRGRPDAPLLVALEPLANLERGLRPAGRPRCDGAAMGPDHARLSLEDQQVLADRDRGHAELGREVRHPDAPRVGDHLRDLLLALRGEHGLGCGGGLHGRIELRMGRGDGFRNFAWLRMRALWRRSIGMSSVRSEKSIAGLESAAVIPYHAIP